MTDFSWEELKQFLLSAFDSSGPRRDYLLRELGWPLDIHVLPTVDNTWRTDADGKSRPTDVFRIIKAGGKCYGLHAKVLGPTSQLTVEQAESYRLRALGMAGAKGYDINTTLLFGRKEKLSKYLGISSKFDAVISYEALAAKTSNLNHV